jgi:hypothetical protein
MKIPSLRAKCQRLQRYVCEMISGVTYIPWGKDQLIEPRESGRTGVDIKLIGEAQQAYPFSIECKNSEIWALPAAIKQVKQNQKKGTEWQVFLSKNHFDTVVVMDAEIWFEVWKEVLELRRLK